jgi:hypothetical protein
MHVGRNATISKSEYMLVPGKSRIKLYDSYNTSAIIIIDPVKGNGIISATKLFRYLGSILSYDMDDSHDIDRRIELASKAFGMIQKYVFAEKQVSYLIKHKIYVAAILSILLYGSDCWYMRMDLFHKLQKFHHRCMRIIYGTSLYKMWRQHISQIHIGQILQIRPVNYYLIKRKLDWIGKVMFMDIDDRLPRKFISSWVYHTRPIGRPLMNFGQSFDFILKKLKINKWKFEKAVKSDANWIQFIDDIASLPDEIFQF